MVPAFTPRSNQTVREATGSGSTTPCAQAQEQRQATRSRWRLSQRTTGQNLRCQRTCRTLSRPSPRHTRSGGLSHLTRAGIGCGGYVPPRTTTRASDGLRWRSRSSRPECDGPVVLTGTSVPNRLSRTMGSSSRRRPRRYRGESTHESGAGTGHRRCWWRSDHGQQGARTARHPPVPRARGWSARGTRHAGAAAASLPVPFPPPRAA